MRYRNHAIFLFCFVFSLLSCGQVDIEGKEAPQFSVEKLSGGKISLSELKGKPVMLYWFAGW